jgi:hypothetical protein
MLSPARAEARPADGARGPACRRVVVADHEGQPPQLAERGEEFRIVGHAPRDALHPPDLHAAKLIARGVGDRLRLQHASVFPHAVVQPHAQKAQVVGNRAEQRAAPHEDLGFLRELEYDRGQPAVLAALVHRSAPRPHRRRRDEGGVRHAERSQRAGCEYGVELFAENALDHTHPHQSIPRP